MPAAVRVVAIGMLVTIILGPGKAAAAQDAAPRRLALVIGEAAYPQARLPTADADAGLIATSLAQAGFDVTALADADAAMLRKTAADFAAKARAAGPGLVLAVYVSGYGVQYAGANWLVPVGARIDGADDVPRAAVRLAELSGPLEAVPGATTRLFLFDVAHETPFARKGQPLARGLALADAPVGSLYGYDTAPGTVAPADVPPYGGYARAVAEAMQAPGLTIGEMLRRVRLRVGERTDGAAVPFDDGSGDPGFAFFPGPRTEPTPLPTIAGLAAPFAYSTAVARDTLPGYADFVAAFPRDPLVGRVRAMAAARREALFWSEAVRANTPRAYWTYLRRYPRGPHLHDVRRQLFALHAALEPPPRFDIVPFEGLPAPPAEEIAALEHLTFADADGPTIPPPPATLLPPPRSAFFDTLPPPPLAPPGSLPLPLPVPAPGEGLPAGSIGEPAVPGGALVAALAAGRDGLVVTTARPDATIVSRLAGAAEHNVRTERQTSADGAVISKVTIATGSDGALTMTQVGPADRPLGRSVNRDAAAGARLVTLFDASGQAVAATTVSAMGIVTGNGVIPGRTLPPRFVLLATPDAPGVPSIASDGEAPRAVAPAPPPVASNPEGGKKDANGTEQPRAAPDGPKSAPPVSADAAKPPALPAAVGLTGQAPALNIPPPPPTPAFDPAAAPVAATPPAPESPAVTPPKPPAASPAAQTAPAAPAPVPAPILAPPVAATLPVPPPVAPLPAPPARPGPAPVPQPAAPNAVRLPSEPPLPPRRDAKPSETKAKSRGRR